MVGFVLSALLLGKQFFMFKKEAVNIAENILYKHSKTTDAELAKVIDILSNHIQDRKSVV